MRRLKGQSKIKERNKKANCKVQNEIEILLKVLKE